MGTDLSDDILDLRVADIACGSGAFLVAAARYLAARLVEVWHREGPATMSPSELETAARRKVVAQCLYGADINAMAVEMCKLSLWLVSLDRDLPFSFVDDKVLHGNSLLGVTDLRQIEAMHIDPHAVEAEGLFEVNKARQVAERLDVDHIVERVRRKRRSSPRRSTIATRNAPQTPSGDNSPRSTTTSRNSGTSPTGSSRLDYGLAANQGKLSTRRTTTCASPPAAHIRSLEKAIQQCLTR